MKIAITGLIASGKSTVTKALAELGWLTLQTDGLAAEASQSPAARSYIAQAFGRSSVTKAELKERFFGDEAFRQGWEAVLHPAVRERCQAAWRQQPAANWAVELPLVYENKLESEYDAVVVCTCEQELAHMRWAAKGRARLDYDRLNSLQIPIAKKLAATPYVITNNGTLLQLQEQVYLLHQKLIRHV